MRTPLHLDQMEELGIPATDIESYARVTASTLALLHWAAGLDGNDMESVLAPPVHTSSPGTSSSGSAYTIADALGTRGVGGIPVMLRRGRGAYPFRGCSLRGLRGQIRKCRRALCKTLSGVEDRKELRQAKYPSKFDAIIIDHLHHPKKPMPKCHRQLRVELPSL